MNKNKTVLVYLCFVFPLCVQDGNNAFMSAILTGNAEPVNLLWKYRNKFDINLANKVSYIVLHFSEDTGI